MLQNPHEERYRKVNISNAAFQQRVASAPGGMEFMTAVGFEPMHGFLVLQNRDPALLWVGKSCLEALRESDEYSRHRNPSTSDLPSASTFHCTFPMLRQVPALEGGGGAGGGAPI